MKLEIVIHAIFPILVNHEVVTATLNAYKLYQGALGLFLTTDWPLAKS